MNGKSVKKLRKIHKEKHGNVKFKYFKKYYMQLSDHKKELLKKGFDV